MAVAAVRVAAVAIAADARSAVDEVAGVGEAPNSEPIGLKFGSAKVEPDVEGEAFLEKGLAFGIGLNGLRRSLQFSDRKGSCSPAQIPNVVPSN